MTPTYTWYSTLIKPSWAPPAWLFGPVWSVLYAIIAVSYARVAWLWLKGRVSTSVVAPFALNLVFNFAFSPIQFGLQNNLLASVDILLVLITIIWGMKAIYRHERWIAYAQVPYLAWVSFATVLQLTITYLNA
jgi:tryptophan-rich sensory protein